MQFLAKTQNNSEDMGFQDCDFLVLKIIQDHLGKRKKKKKEASSDGLRF